MALARWQATIVDAAGNIINGAQVTVRREVAGAPLATLFSDRDGLVSIGNPITVGADGFAAFHVVGGAYRIDAVKDGFTRTWRYVGIGLQQESDAPVLDISYTFDTDTADSDPGVGQFKFNNATLASVTKVFVSETDDLGATLSSWLGRLDDYGSSSDRGVLIIRAIDGSAEFIGQVTGTVADDGDYRDITVTHLASTGTFVSGVRVGMQFQPRGIDGSISGSATADKVVFGAGASSVTGGMPEYSGNLDSIASTSREFSIYAVATGATNGPSGASVNGSHVITSVWDSNAAKQIFLENNSARTWIRTKSGGSWGAWGTVGAGKQSIWVPAGAMYINGASPPLNVAAISGSNVVVVQTRDFDATSEEYAYFSVRMPKGWNEGTLTFQFLWSHAATVTNFGVHFNLYANAFSNDDTLAQNAGTPGAVSDTGGTTDDLYISDESSAITVAGTPAENDIVFFRVNRVPGNAADTLAVDCKIHGIMLFYTTNSNTDD